MVGRLFQLIENQIESLKYRMIKTVQKYTVPIGPIRSKLIYVF